MFAIGKTTHHVADVQPLDVGGVRTMLVGTIAWGIAVVVMLPFWATLRDSGRSWWMWTAMAGFGIGLLGLEYCRTRASHGADSTESNSSPAAKPKKLRGSSPKNTASNRLMEAAQTDPTNTGLLAPGKESLGRKHHLAEQSASEATEQSATEPKPVAESATQPDVSAARPVGRRRKPE